MPTEKYLYHTVNVSKCFNSDDTATSVHLQLIKKANDLQVIA